MNTFNWRLVERAEHLSMFCLQGDAYEEDGVSFTVEQDSTTLNEDMETHDQPSTSTPSVPKSSKDRKRISRERNHIKTHVKQISSPAKRKVVEDISQFMKSSDPYSIFNSSIVSFLQKLMKSK